MLMVEPQPNGTQAYDCQVVAHKMSNKSRFFASDFTLFLDPIFVYLMLVM